MTNTCTDSMWDKALGLSGHLVYIVTEQGGLHVGVLNLHFEPAMTVRRKYMGRLVDAPLLTRLEPLVREDGYGDGSSHGASWQNMLQTLQGLKALSSTSDHRYYIDACLNIAREGANRHPGTCWEAIDEQILWMMSHETYGWVQLRIGGLIDLVTAQLELNYRRYLKTRQEQGLPLIDRGWDQPDWLKEWLDRFYDELYAEELAQSAT